ncbi:MAG: hypothetical protein RLY86_2193 [Pseudomonadota bacterium]
MRGLVDLRLVRTPDEADHTVGALAKSRYGGREGESRELARLAEASLIALYRPLVEVELVTHVRVQPEQANVVDVIEAYGRYRPVSTGAWRWSAKVGAFFPPISLENDAVAWSAYWTISSSAINSWVGEELRTIGGEVRAEWRGDGQRLELVGAVYGWNDPTGILLAYRGWAFHDRWTGLLDNPRMPDEIALHSGRQPPVRTEMFKEIDDRPGWYAGATWQGEGLGRVSVLYYDNRADPSARRGQLAWNTRFGSLGLSTEPAEGWTLLAQGMVGTTEIDPNPIVASRTRFAAAYLLAGWELDMVGLDGWRVAARWDVFTTRERSRALKPELSEHGYALTTALTWKATDWLRLTGEVLHVDSHRSQRVAVGEPAGAVETQAQLSARILF